LEDDQSSRLATYFRQTSTREADLVSALSAYVVDGRGDLPEVWG
jgi:hypothetical protein